MKHSDKAVEAGSHCWSLLTVGEDRQYGGNTGYDDEASEIYRYDSKVPNYRRIRSGDIVLLRDRKYAFGIAVIEELSSEKGKKEHHRCPSCRTTKIKPRKTMLPVWRCHSCGHTFDSPLSDFVDVTKYAAFYGNTYLLLQPSIPVSIIKAATPKAGDQMSMELVDPSLIDWSGQRETEVIERILSLAAHRRYEIPEVSSDEEPADNYDADANRSRRERVLREIGARRGQAGFRNKLIRRFSGRCCISGCGITEALEAAHIRPYVTPNDNHPANGLLLRADIHTLFDLDLIGIDPKDMKVHVNPRLTDSEYTLLNGLTVSTGSGTPSQKAIRERWDMFTGRKHQ